jgi:SAM-dependent methyltransferase
MTASSSEKIWDKFSVGYREKVFTTLQFPQTRAAIIDSIEPGRVLDMGSGPLPNLLRGLAEIPGIEIYASDYSQAMLDQVAAHFHEDDAIHFVLADNRHLPFDDAFFDSVISVNSILPEHRRDVDTMVSEVVRVLKPGGRFVALLPAFETSLNAREWWGLDVECDPVQHREIDTTGWQCFFTREDIEDLVEKHHLERLDLKRIEFKTDEAIEAFRGIYGKQVSAQSLRKRPMFEHFLVARKPDHASLR